MRSPVELVERFRQQGLKVTPQRQVLFEILHGNSGHPSAEAVHHAASELMPGISLRTVYHTLTDLVSMGELGVVDVGHGPTRFDPNTADHHHSLCRRCGAIGDIAVGPHHLATLGTALSSPATHLDGFVADSVEVVIRGLCATCAGGHHLSPSTTSTSSKGRQP